MIPDRFFYPLAALAIAALIAVAMVYPRGEGAAKPAAPPALAKLELQGR